MVVNDCQKIKKMCYWEDEKRTCDLHDLDETADVQQDIEYAISDTTNIKSFGR